MGASQEKSFVALLIEYSDNPRIELPDLIPLYDVAEALAADQNGNPNKLDDARALLYSPRVQLKHTTMLVKREPLPPSPPAFRAPSFRLSQGSSTTPAQRRQAEERRQSGGLTLHQEMNQRRAQVKSSATSVASATKEVKALKLSSIVELLPYITDGKTLLDVLASKASPAVEKQTVPAEIKAPASAMGKAREKRKREQARNICIAAGIADPEEPCAPADFYHKISVPLTSELGYTNDQIKSFRKNTKRDAPQCVASKGLHIPVEVVFCILIQDPATNPKSKRSPSPEAAQG